MKGFGLPDYPLTIGLFFKQGGITGHRNINWYFPRCIQAHGDHCYLPVAWPEAQRTKYPDLSLSPGPVPPVPAAGKQPKRHLQPGVLVRPEVPPCHPSSCTACPGVLEGPERQMYSPHLFRLGSPHSRAVLSHLEWLPSLRAGPHLHGLCHYCLCHHRLCDLCHLDSTGAPPGPGDPWWKWALRSCRWRERAPGPGAAAGTAPPLPQAAKP